MRTEDLKLARFFTARENLKALAEAGPCVGLALTLIPGALETVRREAAVAEREAVETGAQEAAGERESSILTPPRP